MSKHTPGPWRVRHTDSGGSMVESTAVSQTTATVWGAESRANAYLIAAAPEMLEALKDVAHTLRDGVGPALEGASNPGPAQSMRFATADRAKVASHSLAECLARIGAAIAKAEETQ
jgi:uncharacterized protein YcbX